jgi:hypothetical protein
LKNLVIIREPLVSHKIIQLHVVAARRVQHFTAVRRSALLGDNHLFRTTSASGRHRTLEGKIYHHWPYCESGSVRTGWSRFGMIALAAPAM